MMKLKKMIQKLKNDFTEDEKAFLSELLNNISKFNNSYVLSLRFRNHIESTIDKIADDPIHFKVSIGFKARIVMVEEDVQNKYISAVLDILKSTIEVNGVDKKYSVDNSMIELLKSNYFYLTILILKLLEGDNYGK